MDQSLRAKLLMGLGVVLVAAGVVVLVTGDDDTPAAVGAPPVATTLAPMSTAAPVAPSSTAPPPGSSTTSPAPSTTTTTQSPTSTSSTPTSTAAVASETPEEFFVVLKGALDGGDAAVLLDRMNPATLDRYGEEQCEAYAGSVAGTGLDATLLATSDVASWDYATDGETTTLADVVAADIERTVNEQTVPQTTHWQLVDGRYTWFTDCGTPV